MAFIRGSSNKVLYVLLCLRSVGDKEKFIKKGYFKILMVFGFFRKKREEIHGRINSLNDSVTASFSRIKGDMGHIGKWIKHFNEKHSGHEEEIKLLHERMSNIEKQLEGVWTRVQTAVQTGSASKRARTDSRPKQMSVQEKIESLKKLTMMERSIVWVLLNTDIHMSYDDLVVVLGKDKSTLRGQINNIKQKNEDLVCESVERDGKKRFYIEEKVKNNILSSVNKERISVKKERNYKK